MVTVFDVTTLLIFAGLVVLFLQRSVDESPVKDALWQYLVAALGCAIANYLGNHDHEFFAIGVIGITLVFVMYVLQPFARLPRS